MPSVRCRPCDKARLRVDEIAAAGSSHEVMDESPWCRLRVRLDDGTPLGDVILAGSGKPDVAAADALGRLLLEAHRLGMLVTLDEACRPLRDVVALAGLPLEGPTPPTN